MPTIKESAKKIYYQNVKPNIDKVMTNPVTAGLTGGVPGAVYSYFHKPDFDASKAKTQDEAYEMARSTGAKTFIWNGKHYNTNYKGNPKKTLVQQKQEELDTYGITNEQTQNKSLIAERLHSNLYPGSYDNPFGRVFDAVVLNKKSEFKNDSVKSTRQDLFDMLLGYPQTDKSLKISKYKPKNSKDKYYYALNKGDENVLKDSDSNGYDYIKDVSSGMPNNSNTIVGGGEFGKYTLGKTKDYLSYYDKWDINPFGNGNDKPLMELGKPLNIYDRKYFNDDMKKKYATGGQLKAQNNAGMTPYLYNSLPQYGLGSWLAENAGTIGSVAGGIIGSVIPGAGTALGASIGGGLGSLITNSHNQGEANDQKAEQVAMQQQQLSTQNAINNYNAQQRPMYGANFAMGGFMPNVNTWQYSNVGGMNYACGGKMANGGYLMSGRPMATVENNNTSNDNGAAQMTKGLDNITVYPSSSGSHETNKNGGVKVGNYGSVEKNEVRFGKYIFSDRIPYTKSK
jgi:hypothetical protein